MTVSHSTGAPRRTSKLFLLFRMEGDRYALDAREVVEVLPLLRLKRIPEAPEWVAGVFSHRGALVPVLDLCAMAFGRPALARTSTRIVLVEYRARAEAEAVWRGLILEQATDTLRCEPSAFREYGLDNGAARYRGPVYEGPQGLVQWVRGEALLPEAVRSLLFPPAAGEGVA
ncbi:purine-binding chemotaxis protein CheW [Pseudomonas aeruginosa]|nr:purine-binding chemotaxis protein CheW [Pseudomonas aeruginosa]